MTAFFWTGLGFGLVGLTFAILGIAALSDEPGSDTGNAASAILLVGVVLVSIAGACLLASVP